MQFLSPWTCSCLVSWGSRPQSLHHPGRPSSRHGPGLSVGTGSGLSRAILKLGLFLLSVSLNSGKRWSCQLNCHMPAHIAQIGKYTHGQCDSDCATVRRTLRMRPEDV